MFIPIVIFLISLGVGLFLISYPYRIIDIQKKFYEKINWRLEPISMEKEIRNTKIMGIFLVVASMIAAVYVFFH